MFFRWTDSLPHLKVETMAEKHRFYLHVASSFILNIVDYQENPDSLR